MTKNANTVSQFRNIFASVFASALLCSAHTFGIEVVQEDPSISRPSPESRATEAHDIEKPASEELRKVQVIQVPAQQLNFKYKAFKTQWLTSMNDWKTLWKESRMEGDAPNLPVNWKNESTLAIFWPSKDGVVRIPAFSGAEVVDVDGAKQLRLNFNLNSPCFGIITDVSPAQLILIDQTMTDIDRVVIHSENTKSIGCF